MFAGLVDFKHAYLTLIFILWKCCTYPLISGVIRQDRIWCFWPERDRFTSPVTCRLFGQSKRIALCQYGRAMKGHNWIRFDDLCELFFSNRNWIIEIFFLISHQWMFNNKKWNVWNGVFLTKNRMRIRHWWFYSACPLSFMWPVK